MRILRGRLNGAGCFFRPLAVLSISFAFAVQARGQVLNSLNSTLAVNPATQAGMFNWSVDGVNQLAQEWFWVAPGVGGAPTSIDTLPLTTDNQAAGPNQLALGYTAPNYTVGINFLLTGGAAGSHTSDAQLAISIQNTTGSPLALRFYEYSDFDLGGAPGPDTVGISQNPITLGWNAATQVMGPAQLSETVVAQAADEASAAPEFATLALLNGGLPLVLNNNATAGPGNVTWALEWDFNIAPGGTELISKDEYFQGSMVAPEPSVLSLFAAGGLALFALQRRRQRA
jgi:hypothetical protein